MTLVLHGINVSPPVRAVMMVLAALNLPYDFKEVNIMKGEQLSPEFLKMNPTHTVPVLQDGDFFIGNSHAIAMYLAEKAGDNQLYPNDLQTRAALHQRLFFDDATLYAAFKTLTTPIFAEGHAEVPAKQRKAVEDTLDILGKLIQEKGWLVGNSRTIADICTCATVSTILALEPTLNVPQNVSQWFKQCEQLPGYAKDNKPGVDVISNMFAMKKKANAS
ncbi:glutathione S-transferase 1-like [Frankliniella occidentalis]|uniref:Glutathione S-transferase 1-like n=1 Tax=Frankliniella occidentalis TaxID=133901 RepID=A0A6J1SE39_FRAOC|nr:glutathione S-transferase 1-like [Frankliniella occidentalis]XP_026279292.1 glutathione S-transferase 1-like [Frankliniella occidentalis]XP_052130400.1 glutathione S-transferase 1-like [Frankliniella occidentalis]